MNYVKIQDLPEITSTSNTTYIPAIDGASARTSKIKYSNLVKSANNLTTVVDGYVLDARQGKLLDDKISSITAGAPSHNPTGGLNNYAASDNPLFTTGIRIGGASISNNGNTGALISLNGETIASAYIDGNDHSSDSMEFGDRSYASVSFKGKHISILTGIGDGELSNGTGNIDVRAKNVDMSNSQNLLGPNTSALSQGNEILTAASIKRNTSVVLGYGIPDSASGYGSVMIGIYAGKSKVSGVTTFIGNGSGMSATTSNETVAIGGSNTLSSNISGSDIVAIGTRALTGNTTSNGTVALGRDAGANSTNASNSVFIGKGSQPSSITSDNEIVVGYNTYGHGNNTVTIGNNSITNTYLNGVLNSNILKSRYVKPSLTIPSLTYGKVLSTTLSGNQNGPLTYITVVSTTDFPQEGNIYIGSVDAYLYYISKDATKFYLESAAEISVLDGESVVSDGPVQSFTTLNPVAGISVIELYSNSNSLYFNAGDTLNYVYNSVTYSYPIIGLTSTNITCSGNISVRNFEQNANGYLYITRNASNGGKNALDLNVVDGITPYNNAIINSNIIPLSNNVYSLGSSEFKFKDIFVQSAAFNGSDARLKTEVSQFTQNEINASKQLSKEIGTYKWLSAIAEKGENARIHIGMTVQRAIEIMEANNLDPFRYGFIGYDKWESEYEITPAVEAKEAWTEEVKSTRFEEVIIPATETEEEKREVIEVEYVIETIEHPAVEGTPEIKTEIKKAGDSYSFRYTELLAFIARGIEERLSILESNNA